VIIFLHIPKTAGTSLRFILENSFGVSHCHTNHTKKSVFSQADLDFAEKVFPRLRSIAGHNIIDPLQLSVASPFYITFLREPVSRVISQYQESVVRGKNKRSFEECLRENGSLENLHVKLIAGQRDLGKAKRFIEKCDFVGLTEKFDLSLHVLERLCPYKLNMNYKRRRVAKDNTIKQSLQSDNKMMEMAREYNKLDIELYAFAVNEVFPKLCSKAGFSPSDEVASYETYTNEIKLRYVSGRLYNKVFRQLCKIRYRHDLAG
jgi:hypothetical protein